VLEDSLHFHATLMILNGILQKADCIVLFLVALQQKEKFCLIFQECTNFT